MKGLKTKIKDWVLAATIALVAFTAGGIVLSQVKAQNGTNYPSIVQKLADKFNLKEEEVKNVFDEIHQEHQEQKAALMEQRLNQAVEDGVITTEQKEALVKKQAEWQERHRQMMEERQQWMKEPGIDFKKLALYGAGFGCSRGKFGKGMWRF